MPPLIFFIWQNSACRHPNCPLSTKVSHWGGGHCFFFLCHLFYATPKNFSNFYATLFYATPKNFMPPFIMPPPNFEMFMPPFFMPPWIFLVSKKNSKFRGYIDTFSTLFFLAPIFLCHPLLCHPKKNWNLYATLENLMPPFLWGGWHKKNQCPPPPRGGPLSFVKRASTIGHT